MSRSVSPRWPKEQITRDFYCFASKNAVPTKGIPLPSDNTTYYACTGI
jgi:hypothetical protein